MRQYALGESPLPSISKAARSQTGAAIKALFGLIPDTVRLIREEGPEEDVPTESSGMTLVKGDLV